MKGITFGVLPLFFHNFVYQNVNTWYNITHYE